MTTPDDSAGADYTGPDHGFGDDNALAHEIVSFDKLHDTRGVATDDNVEYLGRMGFVPKLSALAPDVQAGINEQLRGLTGDGRAKREEELVHRAIENLALDARVRQGPGAGANAYQVEMFEQANRLRLLETEANRIVSELAEVAGFKAGAVDPTTGEPKAEKVFRFDGDMRLQRELRLKAITQEAEHIQGAEGDRRLKAALGKALEQRKSAADELAIIEEAKSLAVKNLRDERVNGLADAFTRNRRSHVG